MLSPAELLLLAPLQPALRNPLPALVARVEQLTGKRVRITSALRSYAKQAALYADRANSPYPVAAPGTSLHEFGAAVDLSIDNGTDDDYQVLANVAQNEFGLVSGYPDDRVHVHLDQTLGEAQAAWQQLQQQRITVAGWLAMVGVAVAVTQAALSHSRRN